MTVNEPGMMLSVLERWPILLSAMLFLLLSLASGSFSNPFEWTSLFLVLFGTYLVFFSARSPIPSREEGLDIIYSDMEKFFESQNDTRRRELLALVRNLRVTLISGRHLAVKDHFIHSSDPYCIVRVGNTSHTSSIQKRTLNPDWNEEFEFETMNWQREVVHFRLWDMDLVHPDPMGTAVLRLNSTMTFPHECDLDVMRDLEFPADYVRGKLKVRVAIEKPRPTRVPKKHLRRKRANGPAAGK